MSTKVELRNLLDSRLSSKGKEEPISPVNTLSMPEIEPKSSSKVDSQKTVKIREMRPNNQPKMEKGVTSPRLEAQKPAPAYVTRIEDLNDFLRNQLDGTSLQMLDLDGANSWLH